jgi:hypothetical protein
MLYYVFQENLDILYIQEPIIYYWTKTQNYLQFDLHILIDTWGESEDTAEKEEQRSRVLIYTRKIQDIKI